MSVLVYVAGSSLDLERARYAANLVKEHNVANPHAQLVITGYWWDVIEARGEANPVDAQFHERAKYAADDLRGVKECDVLWLLMPTDKQPSVGCFWEAGFADKAGKEVIISGQELERSIFTTRGACFDTDKAAFEYIQDLAFNSFDTGVNGG